MRSVFLMASLMVCASSMANITGDFMGMTAEALVKGLAKQSGEDLRASATVKSEVIFLSVNDKPIEEVKKRLAQAMGAEWVKEGNTWFLTRTGIAAQQQKNKEIAERAGRLRADLAKQVEAQAKLAAFDANEANRLAQEFQAATEAAQNGRDPNSWRKVMDLSDQLPGSRAVVTLLARMDMSALAAVAAGSRQVFSTSPTRMQSGLPNGTIQLAQKMAADQAILNQTAGSRGGPMGQMFMRGPNNGATAAGPATRAMLVATRFASTDSISLTFVAINSAGQAITTSNFSLGGDRDEFFATEPPTEPISGSDSKPVTLRQESKELLSLLQQSFGRGGGNFAIFTGGSDETVTVARTVAGTPSGTPSKPTKLSDSLRAKILRPDLYDPMSFFVADSLKSVSSGHKRDIVAVLPDVLFEDLISPLLSAEPRTNTILKALRTSGMEISDTDGWLSVVPKSPFSAREAVDREALAKLLAVVDRNPVVGLDDLANYFATAPARTGFGFLSFESGYPGIIGGGTSMQGAMQMFGGGRDGLRFYGRLTGNQRSMLKGGASLSLGNLSPAQREAAFETVFWSMDGPRLARPQQGGSRQEMAVSISGGGVSMFGGFDPASERTNLLATGLPPNGIITMRGRTEQAVLVKNPDEGPEVKSTYELAAERSGVFDTGSVSKDTQYQLISQANYSLTFRLGPNYTLTRSLQDPLMDPNGKYLAWEQLPVAFRNEVTKLAEKFAKEEGMQFQNFGGGRQAQP